MSTYAYGKSAEAQRLRQLVDQGTARRAQYADDRRRERERRHANRMRPARPFAEVFAEAEQVRQQVVGDMPVSFYNAGTERLLAATSEAKGWVDTNNRI